MIPLWLYLVHMVMTFALGYLLKRADEIAWRECAKKLRVFAIAYRSHPKRNSEDKLDDALKLYDDLANKRN